MKCQHLFPASPHAPCNDVVGVLSRPLLFSSPFRSMYYLMTNNSARMSWKDFAAKRRTKSFDVIGNASSSCTHHIVIHVTLPEHSPALIGKLSPRENSNRGSRSRRRDAEQSNRQRWKLQCQKGVMEMPPSRQMGP